MASTPDITPQGATASFLSWLRRDLRAALCLGYLLALVIASVAAPLIAQHSPIEQSMDMLAPPSGAHWLGTDDLGRDVFARMVYGAPMSLYASMVAVGVGLIGAVIVIRPNFATFGWIALLPAFAALAFAINMVMVRRASRTRAPLTIQVGATLYGVLVMSAVTLGAHQMGWISFGFAAAPDWAWGAVLAAVTFLLIGFAFSRAEASLLAPFQYLEIVGAVAFGWLVFDDLPDALTCLGTAIILGAGIYVFHRERKVQSAP